MDNKKGIARLAPISDAIEKLAAEKREDEDLKFQQLLSEWRTIDKIFTNRDYFRTYDFCLGWCLAKGLTVKQAREFFVKI